MCACARRQADLAVSLSPGEDSTSDVFASPSTKVLDPNPSSTASTHSDFREHSSPLIKRKGRDNGAVSSFEVEMTETDDTAGGKEEGQETPVDSYKLQQQFDKLKESYEAMCFECQQLREEKSELSSRLEKRYTKYKESQQAVQDLEQLLTRKDTEIKAVLNFQKK